MNDYELDQRYVSIRNNLEVMTPKVRPVLKKSVFEVLPDDLTGDCANHGKFEFQHGEWLTGHKVLSICPECARERQEAIDSEALAKYQEATQSRITDKLRQSGVSDRNISKTFDNYLAESKAQKKALSVAADYAQKICDFDKPFNVIMVGTTGTGKTHLGHAITHHCILAGRTCATVQLRQLVAEYRESWRDHTKPSATEVVKKYGAIDGLVIDEIGLSEMSNNESVILFEILNERYENQKSTVFISNMNINTVKELLGDRVCDRLREDGVKAVAMDWESARGAK